MSGSESILRELGLAGRTRKVRHKKLTAEQWQRLEQEAEARAQTTRNKVLANELQLSELYVAHMVSRLLAERRGDVPRLAHVFALSSSGESDTLSSGPSP